MEDDTRDLIIRSIALTGSAEESEAISRPIIARFNSEVNSIVDRSHGLPRIKAYHVSRFNLTLNQPLSLVGLNSFEIRCYLCNKVISYPCWHYQIAFSVNVFHYFICFDPASNMQVTAKCHRRMK